jgi:hypothetical protein
MVGTSIVGTLHLSDATHPSAVSAFPSSSLEDADVPTFLSLSLYREILLPGKTQLNLSTLRGKELMSISALSFGCVCVIAGIKT